MKRMFGVIKSAVGSARLFSSEAAVVAAARPIAGTGTGAATLFSAGAAYERAAREEAMQQAMREAIHEAGKKFAQYAAASSGEVAGIKPAGPQLK